MFGRLRKQERGSTMVAAMGALAVISALSTAAAATSIQLADTSNSDRDSKRALAAAEAGLQVALYRLNNLDVANNQCITDTRITVALGAGCTYPTTGYADLGNGGSYSYHMTSVMNAGQKCAGVVQPTTGSTATANLLHRCITATGRWNGVARRTQMRSGSSKGTPIFSFKGAIGYDRITLESNPTANGTLGTNRLIEFKKNGAYVRDGVFLGPSAEQPKGTFSAGVTPAIKQRSQAEGNFERVPVEIGNSHLAANNRNDEGITGSFSYDSTYRELTVNGTVTLTGGIYNFCSMRFGNNSTLVVPAGASVIVYLDHPSRDTGCQPGTGVLGPTNNNNKFEIDNKNAPENFQLHAYGNASVEIKNSADFKGAVNVPFGTVNLKNTGDISGAIAANVIEAKNNMKFNWAESTQDIRGLTSKLYRRFQWRECEKRPTDASDPMSGC